MPLSQEYATRLYQLAQNEKTIEKDGLSIRLRPVPNAVTPGNIDPLVLQVHETTPAFGHGQTLEEIRKSMGWDNQDLTTKAVTTVARTIQKDGREIPVRIYTCGGEAAKPCIVFFHGGGFFGGSLATVENPCKLLAEKIGGAVVSVEYRLAPENPFPAGFDDCFAAVEWTFENAATLGINPNAIGVCGDSAGGNLAAVCALKDRDTGKGMICFQGLIYPVVNIGPCPCPDYEWDIHEYNACEEHKAIAFDMAKALGNNPGMLVQLYLQNDVELAAHPYVSPMLAQNLENMPNTIIVNAEFDYLRIEGEAYGQKLKKFGNHVSMLRYEGMDHAFIDKLGLYPQTEDCMAEIAKEFLRGITQQNAEKEG